MTDAVVPQRHIEFEGSTNFRDPDGRGPMRRAMIRR